MVLGVFPTPALLEKHRLTYFTKLCKAVARGDIDAFERELDALQQTFLRHGSFLCASTMRRPSRPPTPTPAALRAPSRRAAHDPRCAGWWSVRR